MSKGKRDIKEALKALKVSEPLRVPKARFQSPEQSAQNNLSPSNPVGTSPTGFSNPTHLPPVTASPSGEMHQGANCPGDETTSGSYPKIPEPEGNMPPGSSENGGPLDSAPTGQIYQGIKEPEVALPSGENTQRYISPTRPETHGAEKPEGKLPTGSPDHPPTFTASNDDRLAPFLPEGRQPALWREKNGELHLPHRLLEFAVKATTSRNELCVFLFFIRYTLGFRRSQCQAGYTFLTEWTGIGDVSNLKKALKTLLASGLIKKLKEHDSARNTGAVYEVPVVRAFLDSSGGDPKKRLDEIAENNQPTGDENQRALNIPASGQITHSPLGKIPTKKENNKQKLNKKPAAEVSLPDKNRKLLALLEIPAVNPSELSEQEKQRVIAEFENQLSPNQLGKLIVDFKAREYPHGYYPPDQIIRNLLALEWARKGTLFTATG